jgi:hypothetical protein
MEKKKMDAGERSNLNDRKVELLEFFGFVWAQSCKGEMGWELRYKELKEFKKRYGHCTFMYWDLGSRNYSGLANGTDDTYFCWNFFFSFLPRFI